METCLITVIAVVVCAIYVCVKDSSKNKRHRSENKSLSEDFIYSEYEQPGVLGRTNLDRFFIECVLSRSNDFSKKKNIEKAKLLADKYNLSYPDGIEKLYSKAYESHMAISNSLNEAELEKVRADERHMYNQLTKYNTYSGRQKRLAMLESRKNDLLHKAKLLDEGKHMLYKSTQQKELDWAVFGGIASGIAGPGTGVMAAAHAQQTNIAIRAENEARRQAIMPTYMYASDSAYKNRENADKIKEEINATATKLLSEPGADKVFEMLEIGDYSVEVTPTGAYIVKAKVSAKENLCIYDDVSAVIDGTIIGTVYEDGTEIGKVTFVLPLYGVSKQIEITGMGLSGATKDKKHTVKFSANDLWLMEK